MDSHKITCDDLDAVGVYFIKGEAQGENSMLIVLSKDDNDENVSLCRVDIAKAVCFMAENDRVTRVFYGADADSQQMKLDCSISEMERMIASISSSGKSRFVRMGDYYIVNHDCFNRISFDEMKLYLHDMSFNPLQLSPPEEPSKQELEEFRPLMSNYAKHPLSELNDTMPELVAFMKKYKRSKSYATSLRKYKVLVWNEYGGI